MAHVAFIGLGRMGHGMAGRYLDSGFTVAVWNRSKSKAEDLIARGARLAHSAVDAADGADAIVTMVADDEASRAVWLAKDGAAATAKAGTLAIECSAISYQHALDLARELRGRGLVYIDSPVTGLPDAAASGKLTLLVGAEPYHGGSCDCRTGRSGYEAGAGGSCNRRCRQSAGDPSFKPIFYSCGGRTVQKPA